MAKVLKEDLPWAEGMNMPERWFFYCPGCMLAQKERTPEYDEEQCRNLAIHCLNVRDIHRFNGNSDLPTFEPSLMYNFVAGYVCHSYVRDGRIQFLGDCTHPLRGQTVDLPEMHPDQLPVN